MWAESNRLSNGLQLIEQEATTFKQTRYTSVWPVRGADTVVLTPNHTQTLITANPVSKMTYGVVEKNIIPWTVCVQHNTFQERDKPKQLHYTINKLTLDWW